MAASFQTLRETYNELIRDVEAAKALDTDLCPPAFIKRTYARAYFSLVEGVVAQLAGLTVQLNEKVEILTANEMSLLMETEPCLDDQGRVKFRPRKAQLRSVLLFTLRSFIKVTEVPYTVTNDGHRWDAFLKSIKIRDRITHPKDYDSLQITDDDMKMLGHANEWFRDTVADLLNLVPDELRMP